MSGRNIGELYERFNPLYSLRGLQLWEQNGNETNIILLEKLDAGNLTFLCFLRTNEHRIENRQKLRWNVAGILSIHVMHINMLLNKFVKEW